MKKVFLLLLGSIIGFYAGLLTNSEVIKENSALELRNSALEMAMNIARERMNASEDAAGQLSDIIRCYRDHHIGETDSIYEYAKDFADSAVIEQYLSEYCFAY